MASSSGILADENGYASMSAKLILVLGGARSGKSRHAESIIANMAPPWTYIATAEAGDVEMAARIKMHRERRGSGWRTVEAPRELSSVLTKCPPTPVLVDCLTLWLANVMAAGRAPAAEIDALVAALARLSGPVVLVANEVGLGIVPENALAREFRDHAGRLNQEIAQIAARVVFVAAGLPLVLKNETGGER
jgi:adenosylcobinamide kinase / adenosylcobinamide-phosphate guanylyltransferase